MPSANEKSSKNLVAADLGAGLPPPVWHTVSPWLLNPVPRIASDVWQRVDEFVGKVRQLAAWAADRTASIMRIRPMIPISMVRPAAIPLAWQQMLDLIWLRHRRKMGLAGRIWATGMEDFADSDDDVGPGVEPYPVGSSPLTRALSRPESGPDVSRASGFGETLGEPVADGLAFESVAGPVDMNRGGLSYGGLQSEDRPYIARSSSGLAGAYPLSRHIRSRQPGVVVRLLGRRLLAFTLPVIERSQVIPRHERGAYSAPAWHRPSGLLTWLGPRPGVAADQQDAPISRIAGLSAPVEVIPHTPGQYDHPDAPRMEDGVAWSSLGHTHTNAISSISPEITQTGMSRENSGRLLFDLLPPNRPVLARVLGSFATVIMSRLSAKASEPLFALPLLRSLPARRGVDVENPPAYRDAVIFPEASTRAEKNPAGFRDMALNLEVDGRAKALGRASPEGQWANQAEVALISPIFMGWQSRPLAAKKGIYRVPSLSPSSLLPALKPLAVGQGELMSSVIYPEVVPSHELGSHERPEVSGHDMMLGRANSEQSQVAGSDNVSPVLSPVLGSHHQVLSARESAYRPPVLSSWQHPLPIGKGALIQDVYGMSASPSQQDLKPAVDFTQRTERDLPRGGEREPSALSQDSSHTPLELLLAAAVEPAAYRGIDHEGVVTTAPVETSHGLGQPGWTAQATPDSHQAAGYSEALPVAFEGTAYYGSQPAPELALAPVGRSAEAASSSAPKAGANLEAEAGEASGPDIDAIARDVYTILKRRLARERERALGLS